IPAAAAAVQAPVAEASTHLMLDLPRLNWLSRSGTRQTSMPWAASVSYRPGSPRSGSPSHLTQPVNVARSIRRSALTGGAARQGGRGGQERREVPVVGARAREPEAHLARAPRHRQVEGPRVHAVRDDGDVAVPAGHRPRQGPGGGGGE